MSKYQEPIRYSSEIQVLDLSVEYSAKRPHWISKERLDGMVIGFMTAHTDPENVQISEFSAFMDWYGVEMVDIAVDSF